MRRKDIEAVGLPGAFVIEGPGNGPHIKATVLETGVTPRYTTTANSVRVRVEEGYLASNSLWEPGGEYTIMALHVIRPWSEAEEEAAALRRECYRVSKALHELMPTFELPARYGALRSTDGGKTVQASVDGAALLKLLEVFGTTKESEHMALALLAWKGDEHAAQVVAEMDPIEGLRYADVRAVVA